MTEFRVSWNDGEPRWWQANDAIPADDYWVREATDEEARLIHRILRHRSPPVEWGARLATLMRASATQSPMPQETT